MHVFILNKNAINPKPKLDGMGYDLLDIIFGIFVFAPAHFLSRLLCVVVVVVVGA